MSMERDNEFRGVATRECSKDITSSNQHHYGERKIFIIECHSEYTMMKQQSNALEKCDFLSYKLQHKNSEELVGLPPKFPRVIDI